ncbi:RadC family protein [Thalassotalea agarivorans]|uniref:DNA repair protein RadC n=1 Tax=Thalassotalea agarivorans TaxID=349064 RepID=A0A1I0GMB6_THASX|nr:DNA repair protein RadC [Thalassotalea agarivorans]SET71371.1 DNA repair protein RadC [Thalassotalea agarivorans]
MKLLSELSEQELIEEAKNILYKRMLNEGKELDSPKAVRDYLHLALGEEEREVFAVIFLNNRHQVIEFEKMFFGTIDSSAVYPREIAKAALKHNSAALIIAHNHPSGDMTPSNADKQITTRIVDAMGLLDIRVLDHFIVGNDSPYSFAEHGLL